MSNLVNDCNIVRCLSRGCGGRDLLKVKWCCARIRNVLSCLSKRGGGRGLLMVSWCCERIKCLRKDDAWRYLDRISI